MIIVQLAGGLGNQMQQYALYRRFLSLGTEAKLDRGWFEDAAQQNVYARRELELAYFRALPMTFATGEEIRALTGGNGPSGYLMRRLGLRRSRMFAETEMYHADLLAKKDAYLTGYFACEKYYAEILPQLRELFVFPEAESAEAGEANRRLALQIEEERLRGIAAVCIHLRRGDYLAPENAALLGGIATPAYYEGAVRTVRRELLQKEQAGCDRCHFYLFSDDPAYAYTLHFGEARETNTVCDWNQGKDSLLDMQLMSLCDGVICANSTFSFWGARLNPRPDKVMVRPSIHKTTQQFIPEQMHALWEGWKLVNPAGEEV